MSSESSENDSIESLLQQGLSRRQALRLLGAGGLAFAGAPLLAACSSSNKSSTATTTGGTTATTAGGGGGGATGSVADIAKYYKIDQAHAGKGLNLDVGLVLAFTGPGAFFGRTMSAGARYSSASRSNVSESFGSTA